ncbi:hypothetical protein NKJ72_19260 [Mesorhizobium sp. M0045]|uniref:hypothetical protein n=1 Tax=Mesorhizobium sp. M0045 TaxID=2956857 RepID=UPI00333BC5CF
MSESWGAPDKDGWQRSGIEFAFYHSLVDEDPAHAAPALEALGRVAAAWSRMEHHLDALIIQVNKPDHSEVLFETHPVSFSKKIDLLKKWFNKYPPLRGYKTDMRELTSRLKILANHDGKEIALSRNILLHAIPASFNADKGEIVLHHMKMLPDGNIRSRHITVSLTNLAAFFDMVQLSNVFLGTITQEMFTLEGYEKIRKR